MRKPGARDACASRNRRSGIRGRPLLSESKKTNSDMIPYYHVLYLMPHEISHLLTSKIHTDNTVRNGKINFNISFGEEGQSHSD